MYHQNDDLPVRITRETEISVLQLRIKNTMQRDIARQLGLSPATVNLLIKGKYRFRQGTEPRTPEAEAMLKLAIEMDKAELLKKLEQYP